MAQHESLLLSLGYLEEQNGFSEEEFDLEELLTELQNLIRRAMRLEDDLDLENTKAKEKSETDKIEDNKPRSNSTSQYICKFPVILSENSVKQFLHFNKSVS